jgi:hypothetical protein
LRKINLTFKTTFVVSWLKLLSRPLAIYSLWLKSVFLLKCWVCPLLRLGTSLYRPALVNRTHTQPSPVHIGPLSAWYIWGDCLYCNFICWPPLLPPQAMNVFA